MLEALHALAGAGSRCGAGDRRARRRSHSRTLTRSTASPSLYWKVLTMRAARFLLRPPTSALALQAAADRSKLNVRIPMRDGVQLSANVFKPAGRGRLPVLLVRTPYGKGNDLFPGYDLFIRGRLRGGHPGRARARPVGWQVPAARAGSQRRQRHAELDRRAVVVRRADRDAGRVVSRDRAVEGRAVGQPAPESDLAGGGRLRRLPRPLLLPRRRLEARAPAVVDGGKPARRGRFREPTFGSYVWHLPLRTADRAATGRTIDFWQHGLDHPSYDSYWRSISTREHIDSVRGAGA